MSMVLMKERDSHVANRCTFARALWHELKDMWNLPPAHEIRYTGRDRVLVLLDKMSEYLRKKMMLFWCRVWHQRNGVIFVKGEARISDLGSYKTILLTFA